jgi:hypothetical protein
VISRLLTPLRETTDALHPYSQVSSRRDATHTCPHAPGRPRACVITQIAATWAAVGPSVPAVWARQARLLCVAFEAVLRALRLELVGTLPEEGAAAATSGAGGAAAGGQSRAARGSGGGGSRLLKVAGTLTMRRARRGAAWEARLDAELDLLRKELVAVQLQVRGGKGGRGKGAPRACAAEGREQAAVSSRRAAPPGRCICRRTREVGAQAGLP